MLVPDNQMGSQEYKILDSHPFNVRRTVLNADTTHTYTQLKPMVTGILMASKQTELEFKSGSDTSANYRFAVVVKFGSAVDQFLTLDSKYNPLIQMKARMWYTDA